MFRFITAATLLYTLILTCLLLSTGCMQIDCKKKCENGLCKLGRCECLLGYEGKYCEQETRVKFYGELTGKDFCTNYNADTSFIIITFGPTQVYQVSIVNLRGFIEDFIGEVRRDGNVYFQRQPIQNSPGGWMEGRLLLVNGKRRLGYTMYLAPPVNDTLNCVWEEF